MPYSSFDEVPESVKTFMKGATDTQKRQWMNIFNSCFSKYKDDGRCIKMANGVLSKRFSSNLQYDTISKDTERIREEIVDGRKAFIIPTIFTREGVQLKRFKPWDELSKSMNGMIGRPVTFQHPPGQTVTNAIVFGKVIKTEEDAVAKAMRGEIAIWQDDPRSQWLVNNIKEGHYLDGSVGYWCTEERKEGMYNGISYVGIERDFVWDHYAVGIERGACPSPSSGLLANADCECLTTNPDSCYCGNFVDDTDEEIRKALYNGEDIKESRGLTMAEETPAGFPSPDETPKPISDLEALAMRQRINELEAELKTYKENEEKRVKAEVDALRSFVKKIAGTSIAPEDIDKMDREKLEVAARALSGKSDFSLRGTAPSGSTPGFSRNAFGYLFTDETVGNLYTNPKRSG